MICHLLPFVKVGQSTCWELLKQTTPITYTFKEWCHCAIWGLTLTFNTLKYDKVWYFLKENYFLNLHTTAHQISFIATWRAYSGTRPFSSDFIMCKKVSTNDDYNKSSFRNLKSMYAIFQMAQMVWIKYSWLKSHSLPMLDLYVYLHGHAWIHILHRSFLEFIAISFFHFFTMNKSEQN